MLFTDQIHTLDYYHHTDPSWNDFMRNRRLLEHTTFDQDITNASTIQPELLAHFETYDLVVVVNAPTDAVRMHPGLYVNALRLLKTGGFFLADHRERADVGMFVNCPQRKLIERSVWLNPVNPDTQGGDRQEEKGIQDNQSQVFTFVRHEVGNPRSRGLTEYLCCQINYHRTPYIRLNQQMIYQKTVAPQVSIGVICQA